MFHLGCVLAWVFTFLGTAGSTVEVVKCLALLQVDFSTETALTAVMISQNRRQKVWQIRKPAATSTAQHRMVREGTLFTPVELSA